MHNRFPAPCSGPFFLARFLARSLIFCFFSPLAHGAEDVSGCGVYFLFAFTVFRHTQSSSIFYRYPTTTTTNQPTQHIKYKKNIIKDATTHVSLRYSVRLLSISLWRALAGSVPSLLPSLLAFLPPSACPGLFLFFLFIVCPQQTSPSPLYSSLVCLHLLLTCTPLLCSASALLPTPSPLPSLSLYLYQFRLVNWKETRIQRQVQTAC